MSNPCGPRTPPMMRYPKMGVILRTKESGVTRTLAARKTRRSLPMDANTMEVAASGTFPTFPLRAPPISSEPESCSPICWKGSSKPKRSRESLVKPGTGPGPGKFAHGGVWVRKREARECDCENLAGFCCQAKASHDPMHIVITRKHHGSATEGKVEVCTICTAEVASKRSRLSRRACQFIDTMGIFVALTVVGLLATGVLLWTVESQSLTVQTMADEGRHRNRD
eukprot:scaffold36512_cov59-Attheya_sp.AAC.2